MVHCAHLDEIQNFVLGAVNNEWKRFERETYEATKALKRYDMLVSRRRWNTDHETYSRQRRIATVSYFNSNDLRVVEKNRNNSPSTARNNTLER